MEKTMDLTTGNLLKKIITFSIPLMLSGVLQLLFNTCDLIVVGKFAGDASLAAVGSTGSLINLIINLFMGVRVGANVTVARAIGKKDYEEVNRLVHTAVLFSVIAGIILMIFGIFTARFWLELMDTTTESIDKATLYLQIYFGGMIFLMLYNFGSSILRAVGETKKPLKYLSLAGVINVVLNLILVIFFHLDVAGVAIATIVSQAISALLVVRHLTKRTDVVKLDIKKLKIDLKALGSMVYIGLPAGVQGILFSISNVVIQSSVNSFDSTAIVAGNTASQNIESFVYVSMNAFYQSSITFTGQNYGAKKIENCKKVLLYSLLCVFISGFVLGIIGYLFGDVLLNLYTDGTEAIGFGKIRMSIIMTTYFLCGIMDVVVGALRGLGKSIVPTIVTILGVCAFRLVWIYTVFGASHTLETLYLSYPLSWLVTGSIHIVSFIFIYKHYKKKFMVEAND